MAPIPAAPGGCWDIRYGCGYFVPIALFVLFVWGINLGHQSGASIWGTNVHAAAEGDPSPETADAIRQRMILPIALSR